MSISVGGLNLAAVYSQDANTVFTGLVAFAALAVGWVAGAIRINRVAGPQRLPDDVQALPFASILFGSFGFFMLATGLIVKMWPWVAAHFLREASESVQTEIETAIASCAPPVLGLLGIWLGDRAIFPLAGKKLGTSARLLPRGVLLGMVGSLIVLPMLFFATALLDRIYRFYEYQHDPEHPMLRAMGQSTNVLARIGIVIGACVIVPIWEEAFFRAHLQTLLRKAFGRLLGDSTGAAWGAVVVTSAVFAMLHPPWTVPIIFLFALGLGYAYERTGNLWVSIAMHSAFNSTSVFLFLLYGPGN